ncbi:FctA domain-containing protein [Adlercreutzia sp. R25]|uniref:Spy0128 family protein n=1 Tax=Adlercreutzia shanghongiae TaxID=3111773 RepID=UPI002DBCDC12|nr:FctA domain-containing protein [Adlercreutzia sp. R25]MEC4273076.1 FctA domain-containing protein [Adlercreutzia sp. R25]
MFDCRTNALGRQLSPALAKLCLSVLLALLLLATLFPAMPFAYGDDAFDAAVGDATQFDEAVLDEAEQDAGASSGVEGDPAGADFDGEVAEDGAAEEPFVASAAPDNQDEPTLETESMGERAAAATVAISGSVGTLTDKAHLTIDKGTSASGCLVYQEKGAYDLVVNGTFKGTIHVTRGAKLTINGSGTINGNNHPTVIHVEGGNSVLNICPDEALGSGVTITGGNGGTHLNDTANFPTYACGGGILVQRIYAGSEDKNKGTGATLNFYRGTVSGNRAGAGGGIYIDRTCLFTMHNGTVTGNTATAGEGGGLYIAGGSKFVRYEGSKQIWEGHGLLEIKKATITDNHTKTTYDWGGGGIFVESKGVLKLGSSLITQNTAEGLGGGIAGCPHASIGIGKITEGFSLYGNTAKRKQWPTNNYLNELKVTYNGKTYIAGDKWAKADRGFTAQKAMDYYCTNVSYVTGYDGAADSSIAWTGRSAGPDNAGKDVTIYKGDSLALPGESLGLTSTKPKTDAVVGRSVVIAGNTSTTHGGGVGCNGTLMIGALPSGDVYSPLSFEVKKDFKNSLGGAIALEGGEFTFELVDEKGKVVAEGANDKNGSVLFSVDFKANLKKIEAGKTGSFSYTIREKPSNSLGLGDITYADEVKVKLTVEHRQQSVSYPNASINVTYHEAVLKKAEANGSIYANGALKFVNTLELSTAIDLPLKKVSEGIGAGAFSFVLQEVENPGEPGAATPAKLKAKGEAQHVEISTSAATSEKPTQSAEGSFHRAYREPGTYWYLLSEVEGGSRDISFDKVAYLLRVDVSVAKDDKSLSAHIGGRWKAEDASSQFEVDSSAGPATFENVAVAYAGFTLEFDKALKSTLGQDLPLEGRTYAFELHDGSLAPEPTLIAEATSDADGKVTLEVASTSYAQQIYEAGEESHPYSFTLREVRGDDSFTTYLDDIEVAVTLGTSAERVTKDGRTVLLVTPQVQKVTMGDKDVTGAFAVDNFYAPNGTWAPAVMKRFLGSGEPGLFSFTLVELEGEPVQGEKLSEANLKTDKIWVGAAADYEKGEAPIAFESPVDYRVDGDEASGKRNDLGSHWYRLVENDGDAPGNDPRVFVFCVEVTQNGDDKTKLDANVAATYYADSLDSSELFPLDNGVVPAFHNFTSELGAVSFASYTAYAASGEPVDQKCLVDPKIYKALEGRTLRPNEFQFQLVRADESYEPTSDVISETGNDEFGMVDFDAANPVNPDAEDPCCLLFTQPGTYRYRVIESPKMNADPSVTYGTEKITFTVVVELRDGVLKATDMYYGYLDGDENIRYKEQYQGWESEAADWVPSSVDFGKLDASWHPTMTNRAKPMDLVVRKTSVLDRNEGLEGATYGLYLVNEAEQADVYLGSATSDAEGWLYFADVALKTGNLYYFMEEAAPAGHTVSEFRSKYFYLVPDAKAGNGYVMKYADSKRALEGSDDLIAPTDGEGGDGNAPDGANAPDESYGGNAASAEDVATEPTEGKDGALLYVYEADGGVYDEATYVEFNKLDARNHEWVEGAKLSIVEKESGAVVNAWTSGQAPEVLQKTLNVGVVYVLREDEAPEGYQKARDVEFRIDQYGSVEILSGTENGNAELSDATITLYDTRIPLEEVVTENREKVRKVPATGSSRDLAKTGDALPLLAIGLAALAALAILVLAARRNRKRPKHGSLK